MWVITDRGFFSAVEDCGDPNVIVVRARVRSDLVALVALAPHRRRIVQGAGTDYPFRTRLTRREWADALVQLAERIDYVNFKDAVDERQGERRHDVYMRVWAILKHLDWVRGGRRARRGQGHLFRGGRQRARRRA